MRIRPLLPLAALLSLLSACAAPPPAGPPLQGRLWSLVALRDQTLPALALPRLPRVELRDGRISGSSGCNRLTGSYQAEGQSLRFGPMAGTRMACLEGMALERDFLQVLGEVAHWRSGAGSLEWLNADGRVLARFSDGLRSYQCSEGGELLLRAEGANAATLHHAGKSYAMRTAPAASGLRYVVEQGRRPDFSMEWHEKGAEGLLLEAPLDDSRKPEDLKVFARCRAG